MIYILLFIIGIIEEIVNISYYRLAHKSYKVACAIVSMIRIYMWAFVIQTIFTDLSNTLPIITAYAFGSAIGDYISLVMEPYIDKLIFKFRRQGRRKRRLYLINNRKM